MQLLASRRGEEDASGWSTIIWITVAVALLFVCATIAYMVYNNVDIGSLFGG